MRRGRLLILFALILLFGALAVYFVLRGIGGPTTNGQATPPPAFEARIVIAAQDIARGSEIPPDGVILSPFPADYIVETMMTDLNLVIGQRARMDIARGVPVTQNMITDAAGDLLPTGSDAAIAIPPGFTAIALPLTRLSGIAFAMRDGDQVDVLATMLMVDLDQDFQSVLPNETRILVAADGALLTALSCEVFTSSAGTTECSNTVAALFGRLDTEENSGQSLYSRPRENQRPRLVSQRIVENSTVLHVGTFPLPEDASAVAQPVDQGAGAPAAQAETVVIPAPDIITLIVRPQEALVLNWALKAGVDLTLTLRAPGDLAATDTTSVTLEYMVETYDIAVPSKLPYGLEPRVDRIVVPALPNDNFAAPQAQ
ncbi:MAG: SAF domain-containing protein [Anaerolineales bacterium]